MGLADGGFTSKPRVGGCADALNTVDVTDLGGSKFLRLPANTIGGETP
jgi:hypothetical protein